MRSKTSSSVQRSIARWPCLSLKFGLLPMSNSNLTMSLLLFFAATRRQVDKSLLNLALIPETAPFVSNKRT